MPTIPSRSFPAPSRPRHARFPILALCATLVAAGVRAEEPSTTIVAEPMIEEPVVAGPSFADLEQRIKLLERQREQESSTPSVAKAGAPGFTVASTDGGWAVRFTGLVHTDVRVFHGDRVRPLPNIVTLRRVRPGVDVTLDRVWTARLVGEFAGSAVSPLEVYLDWRPEPWLGIRTGRFKPPVGYEHLQSDPFVPLIERGPVSALVPVRDVGLEASGAVFGDEISWAVGVFGGVADGASSSADTDDDKELAARVFFKPFKPLGSPCLADFGVGVAGTFGHRAGSAAAPGLPSYLTAGQQTWFAYSGTPTGIASGAATRVVPQAAWYCGRFGVVGEYAGNTQEIVVPKALATRVTLRHEAWQVIGSAVILGTKRGFGGVTSKDGRSLEVTGRIAEASLDPASFTNHAGVAASAPANAATSARAARSWAAGVNWHPVSKVRLSGLYERTRFSGGAAAGGDREDEQVWIARAQVAW